MTAVRAAIVVVNYNGGALVEDAVRSALAQDVRAGAEAAFPVVVVDNVSSDGSADRLDAAFGDRITLIRSHENTGYAGGNNLAFARFPQAEAFALLNPDAIAAPGWLAALLSSAGRHPDWGAIASHIDNAAAPGVLDNVGHRMALDGTVRGRGRGEADHGQYGGERALMIASGCALLLRGDAVRAAGGFDDSFFCYCDDVELCLRLNLLGYQTWYAPDARVAHHFSAAAGVAFNAFKAYHVERNRYWVIAKCFPWPAVPVALGASVVRYAWASIATARGRGPGARLAATAGFKETSRTILRAHRDALLGLPAVLRRRAEEAPRRKLGTLEFLKRWRRDYLPMKVAVSLE